MLKLRFGVCVCVGGGGGGVHLKVQVCSVVLQ